MRKINDSYPLNLNMISVNFSDYNKIFGSLRSRVLPAAEKLMSEGWCKNTYYYFYQKINDYREERMINFAIQRRGLPEEKNNRVKVDSFNAWQESNNEVFKIVSHNK